MSILNTLFKKKEREKEIRYILSIDGGGMRGIIPAYILSSLDNKLKESGEKRPLYSHFDLIGGTSTGALLALGLSIKAERSSRAIDNLPPYAIYENVKLGYFRKEERLKGYIMPLHHPNTLLDIYLNNGEKIFPKNPLSFIGQIFGQKYDTAPFEAFLDSELGDALLEDALVPTIAISYDCVNTRPYIFKSYDSKHFLAKEAARASSAAPLYFSPALLTERDSGEHLVLSDGGLVANNPSLICLSEARKLYPNADEFRVLSLSTCKRKFSFDPSRTSGGAPAWATSITSVYSNAQESLADSLMREQKDVKYLRIYSKILDKRIALDDASKESIETLLDVAKKTYDNQEEELKAFAIELLKSKTRDSVKLQEALLLPENNKALEQIENHI